MKKSLVFIMSLFVIMVLAACGSTSNEVESEVEKDEKKTEEVAEKETKEKSNESVSEVIYDDNNIVITYLGIEKESDSIFGDSIKIKFDVENNNDRNIVIQSENLSADGRMVNESLVTMSEEIAAGKVGAATLNIIELGDEELPSMEEEIELTLRVFDWDDLDFRIDVPVKINLK